jgi:hypothetical protein
MENEESRRQSEMHKVMFYSFAIVLIYIIICILLMNIN